MAATAHSFNKLLSQPRAASKSRATGETDDGTNKLRRMILVEGIPSVVVSTFIKHYRCSGILSREQRIRLCVLEYGKYFFELTNCQPKPTFTMSRAAHAKYERKYGMILLGTPCSWVRERQALHITIGLWQRIKDSKNACRRIC